MARDKRFKPDRFQTISDLGQLKAFSHPLQARMLRFLQKDEMTVPKLASVVEEPDDRVRQHVDTLMQAGLVKDVGQDGDGETLYRAGARYYEFRPDPGEHEPIAGAVSLALLEAVGHELSLSMSSWPAQRMIGQIRRARMSPARAVEFEDRFEELVNEFWGSPDQPVDEKDGDPVMALASVVYRYPDQDE
jgi:DNA-binding transcriptional ArsR family regulator